MTALVIDAFEFCRLMARREGEIAVVELPRLGEESADKSGTVRWVLQGGANKHGHPQLALSVSGVVNLMCQRCLAPFAFDIASHSALVLAADDGGADEIDELLADEEVEVIVGSRSFDIAQLIEDEALLTLPLSPKHDTCPDQLLSESARAVEKISPFAVLKNLKQ
jgi:uncharacterized protein